MENEHFHIGRHHLQREFNAIMVQMETKHEILPQHGTVVE